MAHTTETLFHTLGRRPQPAWVIPQKNNPASFTSTYRRKNVIPHRPHRLPAPPPPPRFHSFLRLPAPRCGAGIHGGVARWVRSTWTLPTDRRRSTFITSRPNGVHGHSEALDVSPRAPQHDISNLLICHVEPMLCHVEPLDLSFRAKPRNLKRPLAETARVTNDPAIQPPLIRT